MQGQFLRQPEYLTLGRRVILSFDKGAKAVGFIDSLSNLVVNPVQEAQTHQSLWKSVSNTQLASLSPNSLDDLLVQVGITDQGTQFVIDVEKRVEQSTSVPQKKKLKKYKKKKRPFKPTLQLIVNLQNPENEEDEIDNPSEPSSSTIEIT